MTTKYDVGDTVMIPAKVNKIMVYPDGTMYYELSKVANNGLIDFISVSEENIIDTLDEYYNPTTKVTHEHE